jgi:hypothetical protein
MGFKLTAITLSDRRKEIAREVQRVRTVVDQHASAGHGRIGVPALRHIDRAGEFDAEGQGIADRSIGHQLTSKLNFGNVTELGGQLETGAMSMGAFH